METNQVLLGAGGGCRETTNKIVSTAKEKESDTKKTSNTADFGKAAVLESSKDKSKEKTTAADRSKLISQLKADAEARMSQLRSLVEKMIAKQGNTVKVATFSDAIDLIKKGDLEVDEETKLQAQKDIAEDGYWGVEQTSERLFSFAKALAFDDPSKIDSMVDAFKEGYEQAKKHWGGELPDICQRTYDAFLEKVDSWKKSFEEDSTVIE